MVLKGGELDSCYSNFVLRLAVHGEDRYASEIISLKMLIVLPLKNAERLMAFFSFETCKYCVGDLDFLKNIVFLLKLEHIKSFILFTKLPATF